MPPLQQYYFDVLMERVRRDRYPSTHLMDHLEQTIYTPEQVADYVALLIAKVDENWFPSGQMLDRVERMLGLAAAASA
jgi:hypothetical protein